MPDITANPVIVASDTMRITRPTLRYQDGYRNVSPHLRDIVMELQSLLVQHGYAVGIDGLFGLGTVAAVQDLQTKNGLFADGVVGNRTWAILIQAKFPTLRLNDGFVHSPNHVRDAVSKMQQALIVKGYVLRVNGRFGYGTEGMVKEFQDDYGLLVTGVADEGTWKVLLDPNAKPVESTEDSDTPVDNGGVGNGTGNNGTGNNGTGNNGGVVVSPTSPPLIVPATPSTHFRNDGRLLGVEVLPKQGLAINPNWGGSTRKMAGMYNRVGGLLEALSDISDIPVHVALGVFFVETGGREHRPGKTVIRFENHKFYDAWGKANKAEFDKYFRFGGVNSAGQPVGRHKNHQFRKSVNEPFRMIHVTDYETQQNNEYEVLDFAIKLCGDRNIPMTCISLGLSQVMGFNYKLIGYPNVGEMYDAFQANEGAHVLGFFDFCRHVNPRMLGYIQQKQWVKFAELYNGTGNEQTYGRLIQDAVGQAKQLDI